MTKLKKKKSKKRTNRTFTLSEIADEDGFAEFRAAMKQLSANLPGNKRKSSLRSILWGLPESVIQSVKILDDLAVNKSGPPKLSELIEVDSIYERPNLTDALELLVVVAALARSIPKIKPNEFSRFLESINRFVLQGDPVLLEEDPIVHQILYGEIPLTIGIHFPLIEIADELVFEGKSQLIFAIEELLDGDGLPNAKYLSLTGLLLSCWTRCCLLCDNDNRECLDVDAETQFEFFVRQMMRLIRRDGTLVFSEDNVDLRKPIQNALKCYFDEDDANIASVVFPKSAKQGAAKQGSAKNGKAKKVSLNSLPESSAYSEWGEVACLQTEWLPDSPKLTLAFQGRKLLAELSTSRVLFSGEIRNRFFVDDRPREVVSDWELVCWHSDQDGDFLELECDLEGDAKWQKHFLLARNELFCLTGDVLLDRSGKSIRLEGQWPLRQDMGFGAPKETRELFLTHKAKTCASILPVSLSEWRSERTDSELSIIDGRMSYSKSGSGNNLYFPVVLDLDPKRCRKPLTWRQLTVAEKLDIVPNAVASAFRVHVANQQWLIYRSMSETANRTFLGQNLNVEFFVGTLEEDGTSNEIISVN